ncbi:hypothetical protein L7F22_018825 [Adiantum nelumboides]|nr:hypothetical protein [Adiantum nelumboides]
MKVCLECLSGQQCPPPNSTSTPSTPLTPSPESSSHPTAGVVIGVTLTAIAAFIFAVLAVFRRRQLYSIRIAAWQRPPIDAMAKPAQTRPWKDRASRVISITSKELRTATKGYHPSMMIGKGGFGNVYSGILNDGQILAIKKACKVERASTFDIELELLAQLNHSCLVNLVGYCEEDQCLVFEFMANGSLQDCLFHKQSARLFDWDQRMKVALQAARGLEYLHVYASPTIIHRDVKASNILLDEALDVHISDFGLSLYGPVGGHTHLSNQSPCGTVGYLNPEYYQSGRLTSKSDVYSFGVVLLELLSGRQSVGNDDS